MICRKPVPFPAVRRDRLLHSANQKIRQQSKSTMYFTTTFAISEQCLIVFYKVFLQGFLTGFLQFPHSPAFFCIHCIFLYFLCFFRPFSCLFLSFSARFSFFLSSVFSLFFCYDSLSSMTEEGFTDSAPGILSEKS